MKNKCSLLKTNSLITLLFCFVIASLTGQNRDSNDNDFWNHVRLGGGIGLSIGDGFFSGTLAPSAIYEFDDQFALGVGLNFTYNDQKNVYSSTVLGGSIIGLYSPIQQIQLSVEFEELNVNRKWDGDLFQDENYWYPALFLGVGYRSRNVTFGVRFDVLYDKFDSIYADSWAPFVRVYF